MTVRTLAKGLATWIPGVHRTFANPKTGLGTGTASYCYGVWMKHLVLLWQHGMRHIPRTVVELGPGASAGTGIAALLTGAERYVGVDAIARADGVRNAELFHELLRLFRNRAPRPTAGYPPYDQYLDGRLFPSSILTEERLEAALARDRVARLEGAVRALATGVPRPEICYQAKAQQDCVGVAQADLVFSHVVMNQVEDLEDTYGRCARWLRPGGWMSHQIDLTSLEITPEWNGHRRYGDLAWKIISGRRPYFINREPAGTHLRVIEEEGFEIIEAIRGFRRHGGISRAEHAERFRSFPDEDLATQTLFVIARRR